jgi:hypothetical protein
LAASAKAGAGVGAAAKAGSLGGIRFERTMYFFSLTGKTLAMALPAVSSATGTAYIASTMQPLVDVRARMAAAAAMPRRMATAHTA